MGNQNQQREYRVERPCRPSFRSALARIRHSRVWRSRPMRFAILFLLMLYPAYFASTFLLVIPGYAASVSDEQLLAGIIGTAIALSAIFAYWETKR